MITVHLPQESDGINYKGQFYSKDENGNVEVPNHIAAFLNLSPCTSGYSGYSGSGISGYSGLGISGYSGYSGYGCFRSGANIGVI